MDEQCDPSEIRWSAVVLAQRVAEASEDGLSLRRLISLRRRLRRLERRLAAVAPSMANRFEKDDGR